MILQTSDEIPDYYNKWTLYGVTNLMNTRSVYDLPLYNMFYVRSGCEFAKDRAPPSPEVMADRVSRNRELGHGH
jgi:hypothetical protein